MPSYWEPQLLTVRIILLICDLSSQPMESRKYTSELRSAQAAATRERVLDAVVEVLAEGVETLSIPAVAERAGVSIGTVYRHFGDKAGLLKALIPHAGKASGISYESLPDTLDEMDGVVRKVFGHFENADDLLRAAFTSRIGRDVRIQDTAGRLEAMRTMIHQIDPHIAGDQLEHLARLLLILTTSDVYLQWKDRLGMDSEEAADEVMWAIRTVIQGIHRD